MRCDPVTVAPEMPRTGLSGQREIRGRPSAAVDRDRARRRPLRAGSCRRGRAPGERCAQLGGVGHAHRGPRRCGRARAQAAASSSPINGGAQHQSVPYMRSPASPRPGTMYPTSFSRSSSAAMQRSASGCSSAARATPSGAAISAASVMSSRAGLAAEPDRVRGRAAGREHRIEHEHAAARQPVRQLEVVGHGPQRLLVAADADEADGRVRQQLERRVEHAEPGAQHRHDRDPRPGDARPLEARQRRLPAIQGSVGSCRGWPRRPRAARSRPRASGTCAGRWSGPAQQRDLVPRDRMVDLEDARGHPSALRQVAVAQVRVERPAAQDRLRALPPAPPGRRPP